MFQVLVIYLSSCPIFRNKLKNHSMSYFLGQKAFKISAKCPPINLMKLTYSTRCGLFDACRGISFFIRRCPLFDAYGNAGCISANEMSLRVWTQIRTRRLISSRKSTTFLYYIEYSGTPPQLEIQCRTYKQKIFATYNLLEKLDHTKLQLLTCLHNF